MSENREYLQDSVEIRIDGLGNHFENLDELENSYFKQAYLQAVKCVKELVKQTEEIMKEQQLLKDMYKYQEIANIISFIGGRGTGKTSALLSFAAALRDYENCRLNHADGLLYHSFADNQRENEAAIQFVCLDCIDGSLLEQGEDIFKMILAQMYNKLRDFNKDMLIRKDPVYENEERKLYQMFDLLYRSIREIGRESDEIWEESAITSLHTLSNSMKLRRDFGNLVKNYLKLFQRAMNENVRSQRQFLVIVVDDLDINVGHGFDMLEKIHRYMMVPQVIVLMAVDFTQLKRLCYLHFFDMLPKVDSIMLAKGPDAEKLAHEFLDKVLPASMRVYVPQLWKSPELRIKKSDTENSCSVKKTVFQAVFEKTGIRFDVDGEKRHYYEPDNLRDLTNLLLDLDELDSVVFKNAEARPSLEICQANHGQIFYDILHRIVGNTLTDSYEKMFSCLSRLSANRSCNKFIEYGICYQTREDDQKALFEKRIAENKLTDFQKDVPYYGYSYGEIMRLIYCWGRINDDAKAFIRSLLAYYSLEFSSLFFQYRFVEDKKRKNELREKFLKILNGSFGGSWSNKMFPKLKWGGHIVETGAFYQVSLTKFQMKLELDSNLLKWDENELIYIERKDEKVDKYLEKIYRTVITICIFFSRPYDKNRKSESELWNIQIQRIDKENWNALQQSGSKWLSSEYNNVIVVQSGEKTMDFNFFNFVGNVFEYKTLIGNIQESLNKILFQESAKENIGVEKEFDDWEGKYGELVLPVYDLDLCYNLMKRIRQYMYHTPDAGEKSEKVWQHFKNIVCVDSEDYKKPDDEEDKREPDCQEDKSVSIMHMLKNNDLFYKSLLLNEEKPAGQWNLPFGDIYKECPVIRWLSQPETYLLPDFEKIMQSVIEYVANQKASARIRPDLEDRSIFDE